LFLQQADLCGIVVSDQLNVTLAAGGKITPRPRSL
jgi:hypothetical protein